MLRLCIFPRGRTYFAPSDKLGRDVVALLTRPTETRERLSADIYKTQEPTNPIGLLQQALETVEANTDLSRKLADAIRSKLITARDDIGAIEAAREAGGLTESEAERLLAQDQQVMDLIQVDDFAPDEIGRQPAKNKPAGKKTTRKKATKKAAKKATEGKE